MHARSPRLRSVASILTVCALACAPAILVGCSSSSQQAVKRSDKTVDTIASLRSEVIGARDQIDRTMSALNTVMTASDAERRTAFRTYTSELSKLQTQADRAKSRADDLRVRGGEYIAKWQAEVNTINNPDLKAQAEARRALVQDRLDEIQAAAQRGKEAYEPLMRDLRDIEKVLGNDLTDAGVRGVAPTVQNANAEAATLRERINGFIAELDTVSGDMTPRK